MIDLDRNMIGVWMLKLSIGDWLLGAWAVEGGGFRAYARFRLYDIANPGTADDNDPKPGQALRFRDPSATVDDVIASVQKLAANVASRFGVGESVDFVDMRACKTPEARLELLCSRPWAHTRVVGAIGDA